MRCHNSSASLDRISDKLSRQERLTREDALELFEIGDVLRLGRLAHQVKLARWGRQAHFVLNRQINPTNICVLSCKFCDFASKPGRPNAYELTIQDVLDRCNDRARHRPAEGGVVGDGSAGAREVHIVGGLHPEWPWAYYTDMLAAIKREHPDIQIKAFTAVEIEFFSKKFRLTIEEVLTQLRAAGLDALPGGGAEVFSERVRKALFPFKIGAPRWLEIHRTAHRLGIPTNSTLLYGHIETHEERVDHMLKLRALQDETRGFMSFIPLAYQVGQTKLVERQASAIEDLKTIAIARLLLDNFPHIKAYWVTMGEESASVALNFGADDIDGTIGEERVMHAAEAATPVAQTRDRLLQLIRDAGCVPVERDALYNQLHVYDDGREPALAGGAR